MLLHQLDARVRKMLADLRGMAVRHNAPVTGIEISPRNEADYKPFENGATWATEGEWWDFRFRLVTPPEFCDRVVLKVITGRENGWDAVNPQFIVRVNGAVNQAVDVNHTEIVLAEKAQPGAEYEIELNGYAAAAEEGQFPPVLRLSFFDVNDQLRELIYDLYVPWQAALLRPEGDRGREWTLESLAKALDLLDLRAPHSAAFDASVAAARSWLKENYYAPRAAMVPEAIAECVGHTHIDVAWRWDIYQSRFKSVRSFATVLKFMELYPEYKFMSSQPVLYQFVKELEPELYGRIKEAVARGQWEPEGGMWVEADCNLASGESLARQFLHGQEFFTREFNKPSRILWLPDVFGYSAALPQLMKLSGIDYFMTTKLSWSEYNLSPYDTFNWKGIDGTEVLTHFSPSRDYGSKQFEELAHFTTYNAMLEPNQLAGGWQRFQQKGIDDHFLVSYGYGDGGGGPTDWMIENARRMEYPLPQTPVARQSHALPFFEALEQRVKDDPRLPKWSGELYLEYHRGTYTAMAKNKRNNRKIELALREVELWCAYAQQLSGFEYPASALHQIWEDVLTLQFHDILPGSSIKKVYDDSDITYAAAFEQLDEIKAKAMSALSAASRGDIVAFNSLSSERDDLVFFDAPESVTHLRDSNQYTYPVQRVGGRAVAFVRGLAAMTATPLWFVEGEANQAQMDVTTERFETPFFAGRFDSAKRIASLVDKRTGRELSKNGQPLNKIVCYENRPHNYDAWDINIYYDRRSWDIDQLVSCEVVENGPVMAVVRATWKYMNSTIAQDMIFYHDIDRVDFDTTADWQEMHYMLKAHFPVDIFYNEATYDTQYGNLKRATHKNTSWDVARFEVCAHKWADVSEDGFGFALLNDCKYGHSVDENGMALTLLKTSTDPNPVADIEVHRFTYSIMPHAEGWREAGVPEMAYKLNIPVSSAPAGGKGAALPAFAQVSAQNVVIEAVKRAEDGDGVIVRLYECYGRRTQAQLTLGRHPVSAEECNILEQATAPADLEGKVIHLSLRPYEIKSFRIR